MGNEDSENAEGFSRRGALGAVYLGGAQLVRVILMLLSAIVIARLLSPSDYGVVAMAAPFVGFVGMFQDLGLGTAAVQTRTLSDDEATGLFWINTVASLTISVVLVALAPFAAWFYGDYRAGYVISASAIGILISGIALQHTALLNREMRFGALSVIEVMNASITFIVSALLAFFLRSYWALVIGTLCGTLFQTVLLWRSVKWVPGRMAFAAARRFAKFSSGVTGFNLLNFLSRNADNILVAKFAGSAALGLYDRSYKLMMMPLQTINGPILRLLLPILSKLNDSPDRYRHAFIFSARSIAMITIPGVMVAAVLSDRLMPLLLGQAWAAAGPIFFWLGLVGSLSPISNLTGVLFLTSGRTGAFFRWGLFSAIVTLSGFVAGSHWGAEGVAASLFITSLLRMPLLFFFAVKGTAIKSSDLFGAQIEPIIASSISVALILQIAPYFETILLLCIAFPLAYAVTLIFALATVEGRSTVFEMWRIAAETIDHLGVGKRLFSGATDQSGR